MSINRVKTVLATIILLTVWVVTQCNAQQRLSQPRHSHVVVLGDSNIWLAGDSCDQPKGWMSWFNQSMAPESCRSYARSGASWSNTPNTTANTEENIAILGDNNVIYNQVLRLIDAHTSGEQPSPTLIMVSAGGNDAWFAGKREHEFDLSVDEAFQGPDDRLLFTTPDQVLSLAGAIRQNTLMLRQAFPEATIVFFTPTPMTKADPDTMAMVSDIIALCGDRLGVPTVRLDTDGPIKRDVELREHVLTYDGVHTNETGAQQVGEYAAERVKVLIGNK